MKDSAEQQLEQLAEWSVGLEISGTAVKSASEARDIHIADSLAGLEVPALTQARRIVDIGSGAGFPGLVLAAVLPSAEVVLVDAVRKKMEAAASIARQIGLQNVECIWGRAEEISVAESPHREAYDVVTARALAQLPVLLEYASPLLTVGGSLVAWKGSPSSEEVNAAESAGAQLGFDRGQMIATQPFAGARERQLFVAKKVGPAPARFPRRAGVARKRPLA